MNTTKYLVKRNGIYNAVPFAKIKQGDTVYCDGIVNSNILVCGQDAHKSGDASYDGYLFYSTDDDSVFPEDIVPARNNEKVKVWCRVGCNLSLTMADALVLFGDNEEAASKKLFELIHYKNALSPNGESYIPYSSVDDFNRTYGTSFPCVDIE